MNPSAAEPRKIQLVVLAASAGGFEATRTILQSLPPAFPAPIALVLHRASEDSLAKVLERQTGVTVRNVREGDRLEPGVVYIAPADRHMRINLDRTVSLVDGTRIRFARSSANPLFETAARAFGSSAIGVVFSGHGRDATNGVQAIKTHGGLIIAQDPSGLRHPHMPESAIETGVVDYILPVRLIGPALVSLANTGSYTPPQNGDGDAASPRGLPLSAQEQAGSTRARPSVPGHPPQKVDSRV